MLAATKVMAQPRAGFVTKAAMVIGCMLTMATLAADESFRFDIASQSLSQALREYARVSGQQILFTEDVVAGMHTAPLVGEYTAEAALSQLLAGTRLVMERSPSGALMIRVSGSPIVGR